jgi:protein-S-isoprenylcysteine O-methyltransferase Ste14
MNIEYLLTLGLFLVSLVTRTTYELAKRAGRLNVKSKTLFAAVFTVMCLLWVSWFMMCPLDPWSLSIPLGARWTGFGVFVAGWVLAIGALLQLKGLEDIDHLVTTGLFSKLRHPMYTGFICWILGWGVYHGALASLIAGVLGIGNVLFWRWLEDEALESRFGDQYREYRKQTWF